MTRPVSDFRISYRGEFHIKVLYRYMVELLIEEGWIPMHKEVLDESFYYENHNDLGKEIMWWWRLTKGPANHVGNPGENYYIYAMDINCHVRTLENIDAVRDGRKVKTTKGEVEIFFSTRVVIDPKGHWRNHWFWKNFHDIMWKRLMKTDLVRHRMYLYRMAYKLHGDMKNFLKLLRYQAPEHPFRAQLGSGKDF